MSRGSRFTSGTRINSVLGLTDLVLEQQGGKAVHRRVEIVLGAIIMAALSASAVLLAGPVGAITPDEWGMDDGRGVGPRVIGTHCLASESHEWADDAAGGKYALWCPPPAFVWVPVK